MHYKIKNNKYTLSLQLYTFELKFSNSGSNICIYVSQNSTLCYVKLTWKPVVLIIIFYIFDLHLFQVGITIISKGII